MQFLTTILALATSAVASPTTKGQQGPVGSTDISVTPAMCTESSYPEGQFGQPVGAGFCGTPIADFNTCYKFADYSGLEPLKNNLTFIFMPTNYNCNLYLGHKCKGDFFQTQSGENDLSNPELGNVTFNDKTKSFKCYAS